MIKLIDFLLYTTVKRKSQKPKIKIIYIKKLQRENQNSTKLTGTLAYQEHVILSTSIKYILSESNLYFNGLVHYFNHKMLKNIKGDFVAYITLFTGINQYSDLYLK